MVLHRGGLSCPAGLATGGIPCGTSVIADGAVVSYTTVSPLPLDPSTPPDRLRRDSLGARGGLVSVTLSVPPGCGPTDPRLTRGTLPCGVRTFLPHARRRKGGCLKSEAKRS